jgi:hypothetical protein
MFSNRVKTKIQVQTKSTLSSQQDPAHYTSTYDAVVKILQSEGPSGLYAGMPGSLVGTASQSYAYFYWHNVLRALYASSTRLPQPPGTFGELALGIGAGSLAQVFTIPVAVITTRQQTVSKEERKGLVGTAKVIIDSEDGWTGLWRGLKAGLVLSLNPGINYGASARLKVLLFPGRNILRPWETFCGSSFSRCKRYKLTFPLVLGVLSKGIATIICQPLIVAKVGLQSKPPPARNGVPFRTFGEVMAFIMEREGILGLWKGLGPQLSKAVLVQGLLMMIKERLVSPLVPVRQLRF